MHEVYGIDCDSPLMRRRSWRWLRSRIESLLDRPLSYMQYEAVDGSKVMPLPSTRLGRVLNPPTFE